MKKTLHIILIDHFDSFTFNLVDLFKKKNFMVTVIRADMSFKNACSYLNNPDYQAVLVLSPGPGNPTEASLAIKLIQHYYSTLPILGVCLGHQIIAYALDGSIEQHTQPLHGKAVYIDHNRAGLFENIPTPLQVGRYHSLFVKNVPSRLSITATYDNMIMGFCHKDYPVYGLQFHPESILTPQGSGIIDNFLEISKKFYQKKQQPHKVDDHA
ncbi:aminodeoxychorismate/anthranilate synthase component II [Candidatus Berkiella cookevillensis]|uniref:anthranilate synthase n=1 Tax=Candidatus Berkiella cookevillensis TaxID=437022 RepID=A0A0Q9YPR8_9GAMM|nr:aminodeoxychorismate/anthranilate synthase component II [Candidatus Berkiella cookevillensis]MCS5708178.1 aminodeoxychorismate/anthranilate synthase component II [Candidatus Berkiella cookevillensis]